MIGFDESEDQVGKEMSENGFPTVFKEVNKIFHGVIVKGGSKGVVKGRFSFSAGLAEFQMMEVFERQRAFSAERRPVALNKALAGRADRKFLFISK